METTTAPPRWMTRCACGHLLMHHDIEEYDGDGSDTCCVEGCDQIGCPGRSEAWLNRANEPTRSPTDD